LAVVAGDVFFALPRMQYIFSQKYLLAEIVMFNPPKLKKQTINAINSSNKSNDFNYRKQSVGFVYCEVFVFKLAIKNQKEK